jgi:hypothetical protein
MAEHTEEEFQASAKIIKKLCFDALMEGTVSSDLKKQIEDDLQGFSEYFNSLFEDLSDFVSSHMTEPNGKLYYKLMHEISTSDSESPQVDLKKRLATPGPALGSGSVAALTQLSSVAASGLGGSIPMSTAALSGAIPSSFAALPGAAAGSLDADISVSDQELDALEQSGAGAAAGGGVPAKSRPHVQRDLPGRAKNILTTQKISEALLESEITRDKAFERKAEISQENIEKCHAVRVVAGIAPIPIPPERFTPTPVAASFVNAILVPATAAPVATSMSVIARSITTNPIDPVDQNSGPLHMSHENLAEHLIIGEIIPKESTERLQKMSEEESCLHSALAARKPACALSPSLGGTSSGSHVGTRGNAGTAAFGPIFNQANIATTSTTTETTDQTLNNNDPLFDVRPANGMSEKAVTDDLFRDTI